MTAFLASLAFVVLAEMGDKTQLLAMAFAVRYRWQTVMWGVFAATVVNHLFAVLIGNYLTQLIPIHYIQIAASVSFIVFGLWTIRGDKLNGEENASRYGPFWTIVIAFFMAEMGDKTQLATIALSAKFNTLLPVWIGSTTGMMLADGLGIIIGIVLGKKIPERTVKWAAAIVFIFFGLFGLYESIDNRMIAFGSIAIAIAVTGTAIYFMSYRNKKSPDRKMK
ncbi:TMEM165/GDT1 family protein [Pectinatus haikarae]|uniref:GDT1 family protein n=1 Tax=Pectinatus haikarae TaxID=349096 RepID=A0ABT9Y9T8_9FIRM|nr:TMEM165/GDT1 family protein [Pectinatus haikarae]MDQ0204605.1 putative Ca2+/H+ antiporter (TMEM165/GDT1 family) [Pectinatus haikarae]